MEPTWRRAEGGVSDQHSEGAKGEGVLFLMLQ